MLRSHLTVLENSASLYPNAPVFRVPKLHPDTGRIEAWDAITYQQFKLDVEAYARHWTRVLSADGVQKRSVVGLWLGGMDYVDALHIYGLSRAGYIPQLFSIRLPNPDVVFELLKRANAKALIFDASFETMLGNSSVPAHLSIGKDQLNVADEILPPITTGSAEDIAFVFHTSGSTSGSPKLVPCSYQWLDCTVRKSYQTCVPKNSSQPDVTVWMGSMCHIGQTFMFIGTLQHGSCVIRPTQISFSSDELMDMITRCGLNRLNQFATFLATHLRNSRTNPKLLAMLQSLDEVLYSGLPLALEEEQWARQNTIQLKNLFGSTECGAMLLSAGGEGPTAHLLSPISHTDYRFVPTEPEESTAAVHQSTTRMLELVILSTSGDCPDPSLRRVDDGHFHTGDLFNEVSPGKYVFRGRDDDWIKSENSLRCDTRAIEDNIRTTCAHLVEECIVVGSGRPSPVLFVEVSGNTDSAKVKREIIRRTRQFHERRYLHERITSAKCIVVVPPKSLPRTATKGNIRRKAVEETYKAELDRIFGLSA